MKLPLIIALKNGFILFNVGEEYFYLPPTPAPFSLFCFPLITQK